METDWAPEGAPPPRDLPELGPESLAAVRQLQGGEVEDSTRHLFDTFEPQLTAYFKRHGCQELEAEDLTQTVFIRMLDQIGTLKDPASFHFWLFKIAGNALRNFVRDRARDRERREDFADQARRDSESGAFWVRGTFEPSPEAKLKVRETVDRRRQLLGRLLQATRLAPRTRRSLLLRLRGHSYQEIARALEISASTVGSHISRASAALIRNLERIDLSGFGAGDPDDDDVAALSSELLTFKREALEADPAYFRAGHLEAGSGTAEAADEVVELPPVLFAEEAEPTEPTEKTEKVDKADQAGCGADSPAAIAAVARQDQRRGRPRRRLRSALLPASERRLKPELGRLEKDGLGYALILLEEAVTRCRRPAGEGAARVADRGLEVKAKLACAGALLARGRRFAAARRAEAIVRQAIVRIDQKLQPKVLAGDIRRQVAEGRNLLRFYFGRNTRRFESCPLPVPNSSSRRQVASAP